MSPPAYSAEPSGLPNHANLTYGSSDFAASHASDSTEDTSSYQGCAAPVYIQTRSVDSQSVHGYRGVDSRCASIEDTIDTHSFGSASPTPTGAPGEGTASGDLGDDNEVLLRH